ncbi:5399_t:CDS:2 [Acaulospora morrowiae]|uniref:5399_t:CDS:1 n=1 Tax=Acaulospora morrowiae TaxID=94023 RepID=A0A9N8W7T3_9GLOM|nr:5399_t:CDS:2 [Acaulospora morrowiae]
MDVNRIHLKAEKKLREEYNIPEIFNQSLKKKLGIAKETTRNVAIVVDFFDLSNSTIAEDMRVIIDQYYNHNLNNKKHQLREFKKELVEHFSAFTGGQLVFLELKLIIYVKQGHVITFRSNILVHGNLSVVADINNAESSTSSGMQKKFKPDIGCSKYSKLGSRSPKVRNSRRSHLDLQPARRGLPAQYRK